jgi:predicted nucleic acid-binding protein
MRIYADTSFLVRLIVAEPGTEVAVAEYRRLDYPSLFFLALHDLEVGNAVRQRVFQQHRSAPGTRRAAMLRERDTALARLERWLQRGWLLEVAADLEEALRRARSLSEQHTERLGCRGFDLLHVALALQLEAETFLTSDRVQAAVAKAAGLNVTLSEAV